MTNEDPIEMERRHVREGEARVAQQEAIVRRLDSSADAAGADGARAAGSFREFLALAKRRLAELERVRSNKRPESASGC